MPDSYTSRPSIKELEKLEQRYKSSSSSSSSTAFSKLSEVKYKDIVETSPTPSVSLIGSETRLQSECDIDNFLQSHLHNSEDSNKLLNRNKEKLPEHLINALWCHLGIKHVANLCNVSERTVYRHVKSLAAAITNEIGEAPTQKPNAWKETSKYAQLKHKVVEVKNKEQNLPQTFSVHTFLLKMLRQTS